MNNSISVKGFIVSDFTFSHNAHDENFYLFNIEVLRTSDASDILPVIISEKMINEDFRTDSYVNLIGQVRSYNMYSEEEKRNKLIIKIFAHDIVLIDDDEDSVNDVFFDGFICKEPIYRLTPLGREICDILIAVNRPHGKSDYIPCITWGRNAHLTKNLKIGTNVTASGRLQSRNYEKKISEDLTLSKVAYEVSISKIESVE